jgi:16S rRNA processing protein RimM
MTPRTGDEPNPRQLLEVGRVARPHGLLGEVVVALVTNRTERLSSGAELVCRAPVAPRSLFENTTGRDLSPPPEDRLLTVRSSKPFQGRYIVQFEGVHSREAADELRSALLFAPALEDPDSLFVHDLVDAGVFELDGTPRGKVVAVQANPASDLLVLEDGNLVPLRFVVDRSPGRLVIDAPAGLFD